MSEHKDNYSDEFNKLYEKYKKNVELNSGGLVTTNKAEFLKLYSFYSAVINPQFMDILAKIYGVKK